MLLVMDGETGEVDTAAEVRAIAAKSIPDRSELSSIEFDVTRPHED